uniref:Uncharacterized protein n=1 Tax=Cannabis sativa TaxID=3483 RepID=A0A803R5N9_CANSA
MKISFGMASYFYLQYFVFQSYFNEELSIVCFYLYDDWFINKSSGLISIDDYNRSERSLTFANCCK